MVKEKGSCGLYLYLKIKHTIITIDRPLEATEYKIFTLDPGKNNQPGGHF